MGTNVVVVYSFHTCNLNLRKTKLAKTTMDNSTIHITQCSTLICFQDFWEQFSHHLATIFLMVFSWMFNLVRVGSLVLCLHDSVDWTLEGAKLNRYMNKTFLCDLLFGLFTIGWFVTRLTMYPYLWVFFKFHIWYYICVVRHLDAVDRNLHGD